jgi:ABC-type multidrug transport system ATPase subunit
MLLNAFFVNFENLKKFSGRTTIIVAHRLSTIRHADVIVCLCESGRVKEVGTHDELMNRRGLYYDMVQAQTKCKKEKTIESVNYLIDENEDETEEGSGEEEVTVVKRLMYRCAKII